METERPARRPRRIAFANQLRGAAAILVAISHLLGVYCDWDVRASVAAQTFAPQQLAPIPWIYRLIAFKWFELGPFGVGLFFLISGLVIPFSLDKHTRRSFLYARILRIYPTFMLALLFEMLLLYGASRYWHHHFGRGFWTIISNLFLVNDLTGNPVVDFVNWTLAIEIKFYLVILLMAASIRAGRTHTLFAVAIGLVIAIHLAALWSTSHHGGTVARLVQVFSRESPYIIFMFIGVLFNFHESDRLGSAGLWLGVVAMSGLFIAAWRLSVMGPYYPIVTVNYLYAIALFGLLYALRHHIHENRVLDFIASISYPFYLVHAIVGFTVMNVLIIAWHVDYYIALAAAFIIVTLIAFILHRTVEMKTITMGHRVAGRRILSAARPASRTGLPSRNPS